MGGFITELLYVGRDVLYLERIHAHTECGCRCCRCGFVCCHTAVGAAAVAAAVRRLVPDGKIVADSLNVIQCFVFLQSIAIYFEGAP